eukprot:2514312-Pleurochrysis_carterae.AAC.2
MPCNSYRASMACIYQFHCFELLVLQRPSWEGEGVASRTFRLSAQSSASRNQPRLASGATPRHPKTFDPTTPATKVPCPCASPPPLSVVQSVHSATLPMRPLRLHSRAFRAGAPALSVAREPQQSRPESKIATRAPRPLLPASHTGGAPRTSGRSPVLPSVSPLSCGGRSPTRTAAPVLASVRYRCRR